MVPTDLGATPPWSRSSSPPPGTLSVHREVTIRGTASDDDAIASVDVDGVMATSNDDFATWQAVVPLSAETTSVLATAVDTEGRETSIELPLHHRPLAHGASDLVWDEGEAFILDQTGDALLSVDIDTGVLHTVSDDASPADDPLRDPVAAAFINDSNDLLVVDAQTLQRVDKTTGARVTVASSNGATGWSAPVGLAVETSFNRALVVDEATGNVIAVDLDDGGTSVLSTNADGAFLGSVGAIAQRPIGWTLYVVNDDNDDGRVVEIDTVDGSRTVINLEHALSSAPYPDTIGAATVDMFSDRLFVGGLAQLHIVDLDTGAVDTEQFPLGDLLPYPLLVTGLSWSTDEQHLLGVGSEGTVFTAREEDGWERQRISGAHHPDVDPPLGYTGSFGYYDGALLRPICDVDWTGFVEIDLTTGERAHLPDWPDHCGTISSCGEVLCSTSPEGLLAVDPVTGSSSAITTLQTVPGWHNGLAYDPARDALMLADVPTLIERLDLAT
ncbi:MAG: hypothetical protein K0V04_38475, partial [Deltaproteobacteria bacterium]|nr:hypothetical protein [Deltaproteobacteria bacterium]